MMNPIHGNQPLQNIPPAGQQGPIAQAPKADSKMPEFKADKAASSNTSAAVMKTIGSMIGKMALIGGGLAAGAIGLALLPLALPGAAVGGAIGGLIGSIKASKEKSGGIIDLGVLHTMAGAAIGAGIGGIASSAPLAIALLCFNKALPKVVPLPELPRIPF